MTMGMAHLKSDEFVDAVDGVLSAARREHLDGCERCREELRQFQEMAGDVRATGDVPEPSPLFWSHMSDRVRVATRPIEPRRSLWRLDWQWAGAAATAVAALLLVAVLRHEPAPSLQPGTATTAPVSELSADQAFASVAEAAAGVSYEDLQEVAQPTGHAADALVIGLSDAERAEFVRLLQAEAGRLE